MIFAERWRKVGHCISTQIEQRIRTLIATHVLSIWQFFLLCVYVGGCFQDFTVFETFWDSFVRRHYFYLFLYILTSHRGYVIFSSMQHKILVSDNCANGKTMANIKANSWLRNLVICTWDQVWLHLHHTCLQVHHNLGHNLQC